MNNWEYFNKKYGQPFGKGAQCQVYRKDDTAYKVLSEGHTLINALHEGYALAIAQELGIPTSNVHGVYMEAGHIVMEMNYVVGKTLLELLEADLAKNDTASMGKRMDKLVEIQLQIHAREIAGLDDLRRNYLYLMKNHPPMDEKLRMGLIRSLQNLPDGTALCHNDYHAGNVLYDGETYAVIDWDSAMIGHPASDVAHSYLACLLTSQELADAYLIRYLTLSDMKREEVDAWMPIHAFVLYEALNQAQPVLSEKLAPFFSSLT